VSKHADARAALLARILLPALILAVVIGVGTVGYHGLGHGRWRWDECLYMTFITLSTVGSSELDGMKDVEWVRAWTVTLIVFGSGTLVYFVSTITAIVLEGDLTDVLRRNRMQRTIDALTDHFVVCGLGTTGRHVVGELVVAGTPFVVIEQDADRVKAVAEELGRDVLFVIGDATHDAVLDDAGIRRAAGFAATLPDDRDNLFVTISARSLNERLRIVAKADDRETEAKLRRAGANSVVLPAFIGGMRIASELVRPTVVQFLDEMLRDRERNYRIEEVEIPAGSKFVGQTLGAAKLRSIADISVLSIRPAGGRYEHNPTGETALVGGSSLVVLGRVDEVQKLRAAVKR
jgi:voltage-gated potassium channel